MNIIKKYLKNFNEDYTSKINNNKELLIEAFIKYYGKEYEEKIRSVFDKTNYFWYISGYNDKIKEQIAMNIINRELNKMLKVITILGLKYDSNDIKCRLGEIVIDENRISIDSGSIVTTGEENVDRVLEILFGKDKIYKENVDCTFNKFFVYSYDEQIELIKKIFGNDVSYEDGVSKIVQVSDFLTKNFPYENEQMNNYLYFYVFNEYMKTNSKEKVICSLFNKNVPDFEKKKITEIVSRIINDEDISCPFSAELAEDVPAVVFNVLLTSDLNFIHEINHSIKSLIFAYIIDDKSVTPVKKSGICIYDGTSDNADILEEILNDIEAEEITKIFHNLGGNLFDDDILKHHFTNSNSYPDFYPLVIKFYSLYKDIIKDASISDDANILYKRVNKEKLNEYAKFIDDVYKNYFDKKIPPEFIDKANKLIDEMSIDLKDEVKIDDYLKELEDSEKVVHKLH